mgnify:FL=1|tara:strand:+ start:1 stop:1053 length:1053 start_codon:yes stop_codon:yes gene_type:complete
MKVYGGGYRPHKVNLVINLSYNTIKSKFMINDDLAPIVIICYNRPEHFKKTIDNLTKCKEAINSNIFIYIDGPKNEDDTKYINVIENLAKKKKNYFHNLEIIKRNKNYGLRKNITMSVSEILNQYNSIIVLEDDIIVSKHFLYYMNNALVYYKNTEKIWHISAYSPINNYLKKDNIYISQLMYCWGWGTWKNRWKKFSSDENLLIKKLDSNLIKDLNFNNTHDSYSQIISNKKKTMNTWAVFWYTSIFLNNGLCINPYTSLSKNIGLDGSGHNSGYDKEMYNLQTLNDSNEYKFNPETKLIEDIDARIEIQKFYKSRKKFINKLLETTIIKIFGEKIGYNIKYILNKFKN